MCMHGSREGVVMRHTKKCAKLKRLGKNFYRKKNKLYDYGNRKVNLLQCQLRNKTSNSNNDPYNHSLGG